MVKAFSQAIQRDISYKIVARRAGDVACCFADPAAAYKIFRMESRKNFARYV